MGAKKNRIVAKTKESLMMTRFSTMEHQVTLGLSVETTIPVCMAKGVAKKIDNIQMRNIYFMARDNFDIVWERNG